MSRIDLAEGFTPENTRILPKHEQVAHASRLQGRTPVMRGSDHPRAKGVITPQGSFGSVAEAAAALGLSRDAAARRARQGRDWRYLR